MRAPAVTIRDIEVPTGAEAMSDTIVPVDSKSEREKSRSVPETLVPSEELPLDTEIEEDPFIGATIAERYRVDALLADGGMGRIYMATDPERGTVALKTLLPRFSVDKALVQRFRRELMTLQQAQCPHVVELYDWGELRDGRAFFVMEYVDGISLGQELSESVGPMDVRRALRITLQLCAALVPAHGLGIVHRDIKPENVMLSTVDGEKDVVKMLDFGLAKPVGAGFGITTPGHVLGTPYYMSPEQCRGGELDHRSDIYSLGVLMYELVCGDPPYPYDELLDVVQGHLLETPTPPSRRNPPIKIPKTLEWMLLCCLHKEPERRFQSMDEVHEEMGHIASALSVELPPSAR